MTTATVIADSVNKDGNRITTLSVRFHRFILPEFNTHRVFSRNFQSSRAIPIAKLIETVKEDPAMPVHWGKHQKGMQADFENEELVRSVYVPDFVSNKQAWLEARDRAVESAQAFAEAGYHKQIINRLIEPFSWSVGVVTATEWDNFFNLRDHPAAQPEIRLLAQRIKEAINASTPALLLEGDWHLPYILPEERSLPTEVKKKISAARCARVSYKTLDTGVNSTVDKDIQLFKSLADEGHMSPMEHQAVSYSACPEFFETNFRGWVQFRTEIESYKYEPN